MYILIDNYDSFTHIIRHYIDKNNNTVEVIRNDKITAIDAINKKPKGIIISPGPKTPNEAGISIELIKLASKKVQFSVGGTYFSKIKITIRDKMALKLLEFRLLLILSKVLLPLYSILIKCKPNVPKIKGLR